MGPKTYSLARMLSEACERFGDRPLLVLPLGGDAFPEYLFYRQFLLGVRTWADFLADKGIGPGDRVAIITPKCRRQIQAFYACWWLGGIAVPICESLGDRERDFILDDSDPALLLVDKAYQEAFDQARLTREVVALQDMPPAGADPGRKQPAEVENDHTAALIYTSGSTGMPKGVMLTHRNLHVNAIGVRAAYRFGPSDRIMSLLPYWHSYALVCEVITAPLCGAQVALPRDKRDFARHIARYDPTIVLLVPRIAAALRDGILKGLAGAAPPLRRLADIALNNALTAVHDTAGPPPLAKTPRTWLHRCLFQPLIFRRIRQRFGRRLRFFVSGGAPLDLDHQRFFKALGLPIYQGYGLTESSPVISVNLPERHRLGSSGVLLNWLQPEQGGDYTFRDAEGNTAKHLHGELLVKGDCVMQGYWRHTDASAKTLEDGWLHTGDMGYVDTDGFLFLEGRQGNMIVLVGGEKVHPEPIENALKQADIVTEAMVIGEGCKNIYALVNLQEELVAGLDAADLDRRLQQAIRETTAHLAAYQKPKALLPLPDFTPENGLLTPTLKIRRHQIQTRYREKIRDFLARNGEKVKIEAAESPRHGNAG